MNFFARVTFYLTLCLCASTTVLNGQNSGYARVKIFGNSQDIQALAAAGIALDHVQFISDGLVGEFSPWEIDQIGRMGLATEVLHPDASVWYQERYSSASNFTYGNESVASAPSAFNLGSMGGCLTYAEALAELDSMYLSFPTLISPRDSIGTTHEGRTIWAVKISDNPGLDETEPEVLYVGLHHAREPLSLMNLIYFMQYLLENYGSSAMVTHLVNNRELYFVPVLNPDGYVYNETTHPNGGGMWRKNRRNNGSNSYGVDLNRNYSFQWAYDNLGSSGDPNAETYRGPSPFSEPETQALRKFCMARNFVTSLSHHAWGQEMMNPWGYDPAVFLASEERFHRYGEFLTQSSRYVPGNAAQTVGYPSNGNSDDWMYGDQTDKPEIIAFSSEIGDNTDWFWPPMPRILPLCEEMLEANLRIACLAGECVNVRPQVPCDLAGSQVWLPIRFENLGLDSATSFNAQFFSSDPNILSINQGSFVISSLGSGQNALDSFKVSLAQGIAKGTIIGGVVRTNLPGGVVREDSIKFSYGIPEVILAEGGESGLGQWTGTWNTTDERAHTGVFSITDSPLQYYAPGYVQTIALQSPLDLENYTRVRLEFFATWEVEANWDYVVVEASDNGLNYQPLPGQYTDPGSGNHQPSGEPVFDGNRFSWVKEKIDLSAYDGSPQLYLRFSLSSNSFQERDGFYFDDLQVTGFKTVVGIDPNDPFSELHLYPNPAQGYVKLGGHAGIAEPMSMELYDLQGKLLLSQPLGQDDRIELAQLSAGVYLYRFCTAQDRGKMQKLILR